MEVVEVEQAQEPSVRADLQTTPLVRGRYPAAGTWGQTDPPAETQRSGDGCQSQAEEVEVVEVEEAG